MMQRLTPVVKNLLIINIVVYILQFLLSGIDFTGKISLYKIGSENFAPYQFFTYMFAHGGLFHILFNMMGLVFLGPLLESFWGSKRFLTFYLITGLGAGVIYNAIEYVRINNIRNDVEAYIASPNPSDFNVLIIDHIDNANPKIYEFINMYDRNPENEEFEERSVVYARQLYTETLNYGSMLGASGAIYGILMAFGLLFPNTELMLLFPPIPIKAKYLALGLGLIAIFSGLNRAPGDNVAHFAHLGGMVFAFIMIQYWQKGRDKFY
jgi:membrane associated rhomboid family serine protease